MSKKVLIGMSGGVDSSVSALLLKQAGYEVIGVTLSLCPNGSCCNVNTYNDAKNVCKAIGIEHFILDATSEFRKYVIDDFINSYSNCKTPNPCIECNKYLKFNFMYEKAKELGIDYIATGHYAKVEYSEKYKQYVLKKSDSEKKDQTYFLYSIDKEVLPKIIFPLEQYKDKEMVRQIARDNGLIVAEKSDSQEVCFVPDDDYVGFLNRELKEKPRPGNIILRDGTILGKHTGLINYTVGQRKGLGIAYKEPLYVLELRAKTNELVVGTENELYSKELYANELNFLLDIDLSKPVEIKAKIRYRAKEAEAVLYPQENGICKVEFKEPQRAITPGQSVVFYIDDDIVLGGGKIV